MALVEIEDATLTRLKSFEEMFDKIGKGKNRSKLLALVKEDFPDLPIPELDAAKPVYDEIEKIRAELAAEREERAKERAERDDADKKSAANKTIAESRQMLRQDGWDDEGIEKIETYMRENGTPDYKSAAAYVRSQLPQTPDRLPATYAGQGWDWFRAPDQDVDHKLLLKNPRAYQDQVVASWITDLRRGNGRRA